MAISQITDSEKCCGCSVCEAVCPKQCIDMITNNEGFLYPKIDEYKCVECNLCVKTCPINTCPESSNRDFEREVYACKNTNLSILNKSSSGGIFYELAKYVLDRKGIVYGVAFKNGNVIHVKAENEAELMPLLGSKYVQSDKRDIWKSVRIELTSGRLVLFSGTPCEIGALRSYLRRDYDNLICVDFICMGTPSPGVLKRHLEDLEGRYQSKIRDLSFRSKKYGAFTHSLSLRFDNGKSYFRTQFAEPFVKSFHSGLFLRRSCHCCSYKKIYRESDFTMADFWNSQNAHIPLSTKDGLSMLIIHSKAGKDIFEDIKYKFETYRTSIEVAEKVQPMLIASCPSLPHREDFFMDYLSHKNERFSDIVNKYVYISNKDILRSKLKQISFLRHIVQRIKSK